MQGMSKAHPRKSPARIRSSVTLTLAPATLAYLDAYAAARGLSRSAGLDALVSAHASAVTHRLPSGSDAQVEFLAGLMREVGVNPGLDPALRLQALVSVGRILRPSEEAALDAARDLLSGLPAEARVAMLEATEARAARP
jgi:hypothetical protein